MGVPRGGLCDPTLPLMGCSAPPTGLPTGHLSQGLTPHPSPIGLGPCLLSRSSAFTGTGHLESGPGPASEVPTPRVSSCPSFCPHSQLRSPRPCQHLPLPPRILMTQRSSLCSWPRHGMLSQQPWAGRTSPKACPPALREDHREHAEATAPRAGTERQRPRGGGLAPASSPRTAQPGRPLSWAAGASADRHGRLRTGPPRPLPCRVFGMCGCPCVSLRVCSSPAGRKQRPQGLSV